jgi:hypothetical protein
VASIDGNPRPLGSIKDIFRRQYILFNPDRFTGPDTWRLNLPAEVRCADEDPCTTESILKAEAPIVRFEDARNYDLYFVINSVPEVPPKFRANRKLGVLVIPPQMKAGPNHCDIEDITAFPPLFTTVSSGDVNINFKINPLPDVPSIRNQRHQLSYTNSRTVASVTADPPVKSETVGLETTVSFDITPLPSLP